MAATERARRTHVISTESAMAGILAILVDEREERTKENKGLEKTEVLLARVGLPIDDIVALTGKKSDAVRKAIQRGRSK